LLALVAATAPPAAAANRSLWSMSGQRPGPPILYATPATAPQLTNAGVWHAGPILVSGAEAYRRGEWLYQDYLYDDHGAHDVGDPTDPQTGQAGDLFSMPNGTYTYPTGPGYAGDAADLVEFRTKPLRRATAFRITLNTLENPALIAFSMAIGGRAGTTYQFPYDANVVAPADLFLTVHPNPAGTLTAQLVRAASGRPVPGPAPGVRLDRHRRQIEVDIPHRAWNPRRSRVRLALGVGLWDAAHGRYLLPGLVASATRPGGAGLAAHPSAFFNVAFRTHEPEPSVEDSTNAVLNAAWWRDRAQAAALARGDISSLSATVDYGKLARRVTDNSQVPRTGSIDRILASHFEPAQGVDFAHPCGLTGSPDAGTCTPSYLGRLQPYDVYIPAARPPRSGYGLTLLLHSLSANYNQYTGSRNQSQFGDRPVPSIVITPEARGPDQAYEGLGAADVFEVWGDVARRYHLDPAYTDITGYSMGGIGTFTLAEQFPDLFARAQPTVGDSSDNNLVPSLRNIPVLMWNNATDELVNPLFYTRTGSKLAQLGYRYALDVYRPCVSTLCSPLFPNHLELAINDQYAPAAAFLGSATVDPNPPHVTYVTAPTLDVPRYGLTAGHAYWLSSLTPRVPGAEAQIDAVSKEFGIGDPAPSALSLGLGTLAGGHMGPLQYASFTRTWGAAPRTRRADEIDVHATGLASAAIDVRRAHADCHVVVNVTSDGPLRIRLLGCRRTIRVP
jgi:hypothetical protein